MAKRQNKIRWGKSEKQELQRIVKNFNAKIDRNIKKNPNADYLPTKIHYKDLVNSIETRKELNSIKESLQRFSKKGMEKLVTLDSGITVTKWHERELEDSVKSFNNKLKYHKRKFHGNAPYLPNEKDISKHKNRSNRRFFR